MAFGRMGPIRSKVCINDRILEQVIASIICYILHLMKEKYSESKNGKSVKKLRNNRQLFEPSLVFRYINIQIYRTLTRPSLYYGDNHGQYELMRDD